MFSLKFKRIKLLFAIIILIFTFSSTSLLVLGTYYNSHNDHFNQKDADVTVDITVAGGPLEVHNDFAFLKDWPDTLIKVDVSDITNPGLPSNVTDGNLIAGDYDIYDDKLFVTMYRHMLVYDVTNPNAIGDPIYNWTQGDYDPVYDPSHITIANDIAYIVDSGVLYIFDFSDLSNIIYLNQLNLDNPFREMIYVNDYLYFSLDHSDNNYFGLVDVSNTLVLNSMITLENSSVDGSWDVAVKDNYAYMTVNNFADHRCFLTVVDISNKAQPEELTSVELDADNAYHITVHENTAYIGLDDKGLAVVDISDPENPGEPIYNGFGRYPCDVHYVLVHNNHLLFTYNPGLGIVSLADASKVTKSMVYYPLIMIPGLIFPVFTKRKRKN